MNQIDEAHRNKKDCDALIEMMAEAVKRMRKCVVAEILAKRYAELVARREAEDRGERLP